MTSTSLDLDGVSVRAGDTLLLDDVSISIGSGEIVAVIGANGSGKTTLLDAISGVVALSAGTVSMSPAKIGRAFQGSPLPGTLTVAECVSLVTPTRAEAEAVLDKFGLTPHSSSFVGELSTGMRRILDVAVATAGDPALLLLDEPASGLAVAEVEHLAEMVIKWRNRTGGAVLIVEHDQQLVRRVADFVVVLEGGVVVECGPPDEVLHIDRARPSGERVVAHTVGATQRSRNGTNGSNGSGPKVWAGADGAPSRVRSAAAPEFMAALARVAADAAPAMPPARRVLSTWTLLRLGLREFSAGLGSVMILGVLNRVMKVELGVSLVVVAAVLASYNLAAPVALAIGHRSDTHPIRGRRRSPYIVAGSVLTGLTVVAAPHAAGILADGVTPVSVTVSVALFVAMGIGMYGSGAVFFALIVDLAPPKERGHAASIVYLELMVGILAGVALTSSVVEKDAGNLSSLFGLAGLLIVVCSVAAVWGQEDRALPVAEEDRDAEHVPFRVAFRSIYRMRQARVFFLFMVGATLFLFLQQAVLEPYGGDVLGLDVRQTSSFNAVMTVGILIGMLLAGRTYAQQLGHHNVATIGLLTASVAFGCLALAAAAESAPPSWLAIFAVGWSTGLFNVSTLALMMGMADAKRTALFMGAWTVAHALADGLAVAGGGVVYEITRSITGSVSGGYTVVFAVEAIGLALCIPLLRLVKPERFQAELSGATLDNELS